MQFNMLQFVVGRQLALGQGVSDGDATRYGLVGSFLGEGLVGPVVARTLAGRDAPAPTAATGGELLSGGSLSGSGSAGGSKDPDRENVAGALDGLRKQSARMEIVHAGLAQLAAAREKLEANEALQREAMTQSTRALFASVRELVDGLSSRHGDLWDEFFETLGEEQCRQDPELAALREAFRTKDFSKLPGASPDADAARGKSEGKHAKAGKSAE
ncbi:MAG TPA: hypothetical protein VJP77_00355 [Planctomycetota bacterium]|nr:hypothetical protein [Planctomycetota bacterium]